VKFSHADEAAWGMLGAEIEISCGGVAGSGTVSGTSVIQPAEDVLPGRSPVAGRADTSCGGVHDAGMSASCGGVHGSGISVVEG
jgi:hypothetical protein